MDILPLDKNIILAALSVPNQQQLGAVFIFPEIDSTNQYLLQQAAHLPSLSVCLAEKQTVGRGRHGKQWQSPQGNIYLSILQHYDSAAHQLTGLSVAIGIELAQALESCAIQPLRVKWPNDLLWNNRKLAGILVESKLIANHCSIVVGIGINYSLTLSEQAIDQPWVDILTIQPLLNRSVIIGYLLNKLLPIIRNYSYEYFQLYDYQNSWSQYDSWIGKKVTLYQSSGAIIQGINLGIDTMGALKLQVDGEVKVFQSGEVSLRSG